MTAFEFVAAMYFASLAVLAWLAATPLWRRLLVSIAAIIAVTLIAAVADAAGLTARDWLPHAYLAAGYWLPAALVSRPPRANRFEAWLISSDARLRPSLPSLPPSLTHAAEFAYLLCYPLVPASFALVWVWGGAEDIERYWLAVLLAGYCCYVTLPWLISRPPRFVAASPQSATRLRAMNAFVLGRLSHQLNTFPSGHVAVAWAAAAGVSRVSMRAGLAFAALAMAISVGAASGRYHYIVDVIAGMLVAVLVALAIF